LAFLTPFQASRNSCLVSVAFPDASNGLSESRVFSPPLMTSISSSSFVQHLASVFGSSSSHHVVGGFLLFFFLFPSLAGLVAESC
jgi:hypothetical protein